MLPGAVNGLFVNDLHKRAANKLTLDLSFSAPLHINIRFNMKQAHIVRLKDFFFFFQETVTVFYHLCKDIKSFPLSLDEMKNKQYKNTELTDFAGRNLQLALSGFVGYS